MHLSITSFDLPATFAIFASIAPLVFIFISDKNSSISSILASSSISFFKQVSITSFEKSFFVLFFFFSLVFVLLVFDCLVFNCT